MRPPSTLQVKTVRGTPIRAHGRTFTPVARVTSAVKHRATIGADKIEGSGWGFAHTYPSRWKKNERTRSSRTPSPTGPAPCSGQMALTALVFPVICTAVIAVARWLQDLDEQPEQNTHRSPPSGRRKRRQDMSLERMFDTLEGLRSTASVDAAFGQPQETKGRTHDPREQRPGGHGYGLWSRGRGRRRGTRASVG